MANEKLSFKQLRFDTDASGVGQGEFEGTDGQVGLIDASIVWTAGGKLQDLGNTSMVLGATGGLRMRIANAGTGPLGPNLANATNLAVTIDINSGEVDSNAGYTTAFAGTYSSDSDGLTDITVTQPGNMYLQSQFSTYRILLENADTGAMDLSFTPGVAGIDGIQIDLFVDIGPMKVRGRPAGSPDAFLTPGDYDKITGLGQQVQNLDFDPSNAYQPTLIGGSGNAALADWKTAVDALATPLQAVARKDWVDEVFATRDFNWKKSCVWAVNNDQAVYAMDGSGILTLGTNIGRAQMDGSMSEPTQVGQRLLVLEAADASLNGIYEVTQVGADAAHDEVIASDGAANDPANGANVAARWGGMEIVLTGPAGVTETFKIIDDGAGPNRTQGESGGKIQIGLLNTDTYTSALQFIKQEMSGPSRTHGAYVIDESDGLKFYNAASSAAGSAEVNILTVSAGPGAAADWASCDQGAQAFSAGTELQLQRTDDADTFAALKGASVYVEQGAYYKDTIHFVSTDACASFADGTPQSGDPIAWILRSGIAQYTLDTGLYFSDARTIALKDDDILAAKLKARRLTLDSTATAMSGLPALSESMKEDTNYTFYEAQHSWGNVWDSSLSYSRAQDHELYLNGVLLEMASAADAVWGGSAVTDDGDYFLSTSGAASLSLALGDGADDNVVPKKNDQMVITAKNGAVTMNINFLENQKAAMVYELGDGTTAIDTSEVAVALEFDTFDLANSASGGDSVACKIEYVDDGSPGDANFVADGSNLSLRVSLVDNGNHIQNEFSITASQFDDDKVQYITKWIQAKFMYLVTNEINSCQLQDYKIGSVKSDGNGIPKWSFSIKAVANHADNTVRTDGQPGFNIAMTEDADSLSARLGTDTTGISKDNPSYQAGDITSPTSNSRFVPDGGDLKMDIYIAHDNSSDIQQMSEGIRSAMADLVTNAVNALQLDGYTVSALTSAVGDYRFSLSADTEEWQTLDLGYSETDSRGILGNNAGDHGAPLTGAQIKLVLDSDLCVEEDLLEIRYLKSS